MFGLEWSELISTVAILAACGLAGGFLAGLLGIGGGIIFVPVFYYIFTSAFHVDPSVAMMLATGTSLTCMIPTSITAALAQYRNGNTNMETIKTWAPGLIIGVLTGSLISSFYGGKWLVILFGSMMLLNSLNTFFRAKAKPMFDSLPGKLGQRIIAFCISFLSVMLGVGGGTLTVPVLNACSEKPHRSVGTSSAVSLFVGIPGALVLFFTGVTPDNAPVFTIGYVSLLAVACVIPMSILTAPLGVKIGKGVSPATLKRIFAVAMFLVSVRMLISGLS
ncbi:sulfite exporter TauE/SafE family protein [Anaerobiospirillum sp. NML120449]|uniref:sulfite exporter TauE/SafE family protein n=1 Tax=Anaerobiospirillum sp. NML120449 TaxID=2932817 RepID=UPI001FF49464|nr:sulfite exporter TauE/SafE family protein [Anaerobiospirillum sp. NML120449]MCK0526827.1 sulfite exporter TauE/SafE family protein [Anaerobiospirillum sp. NML120449]